MCNIWDALKEAGQCAKAVCFCLICMICSGPILLIIGIVMIVSPNHRSDKVKQYNDAVKQYNSGPIQSWKGTIGGAPISVSNEKVEVEGDTNDVDSATSYFAQASVKNSPSLVDFNIIYVKPFSRSGIQYSKSMSKDAYCDQKKGCSASSMESYCRTKYGNSARYQGAGCSNSGSCGKCQYDTYLQSYCAVVSAISSSNNYINNYENLLLNNVSNQTTITNVTTTKLPMNTTTIISTTGFVPHKYQEDATKQSCFYPFGPSNQVYSTNSITSVAFQLRTSDDPFIALQRITMGSKDFGLSSKNQRLIGLALLIVGIVIIACISLVVYIIYRLVKGRNNQNQPPAPGYQPQSYQPSPGYPMQQFPPQNPGDAYYPPSQPSYQPYYPPQQPPQPQGYGYGSPPLQPPPPQGYGYGYKN